MHQGQNRRKPNPLVSEVSAYEDQTKDKEAGLTEQLGQTKIGKTLKGQPGVGRQVRAVISKQE
jgi:hypothetical protein